MPSGSHRGRETNASQSLRLNPLKITFVRPAVRAGIFKPCVSPAVSDQYTHQREAVVTLKSVDRVIVDPETTDYRPHHDDLVLVRQHQAFFAFATTHVDSLQYCCHEPVWILNCSLCRDSFQDTRNPNTNFLSLTFFEQQAL